MPVLVPLPIPVPFCPSLSPSLCPPLSLSLPAARSSLVPPPLPVLTFLGPHVKTQPLDFLLGFGQDKETSNHLCCGVDLYVKWEGKKKPDGEKAEGGWRGRREAEERPEGGRSEREGPGRWRSRTNSNFSGQYGVEEELLYLVTCSCANGGEKCQQDLFTHTGSLIGLTR
jgi:hypothetical protein